jgi:hypothetical protein
MTGENNNTCDCVVEHKIDNMVVNNSDKDKDVTADMDSRICCFCFVLLYKYDQICSSRNVLHR